MTFGYPDSHIKDTYNFGRPKAGGSEAVMYGTVAYTDTTAKTLFILPRGAIVTDIQIVVKTAFNSSGTDLLDVGVTGTAAYFVDDFDVSATGNVHVQDAVTSRLFTTALSAQTTVTATYTQSVADASAGSAVVAIRYMLA